MKLFADKSNTLINLLNVFKKYPFIDDNDFFEKVNPIQFDEIINFDEKILEYRTQYEEDMYRKFSLSKISIC